MPGDRVNDHRNGRDFWLEVISIEDSGPLTTVTFRSALGLASASYRSNAYIPTMQPHHFTN